MDKIHTRGFFFSLMTFKEKKRRQIFKKHCPFLDFQTIVKKNVLDEFLFSLPIQSGKEILKLAFLEIHKFEQYAWYALLSIPNAISRSSTTTSKNNFFAFYLKIVVENFFHKIILSFKFEHPFQESLSKVCAFI